MRHRALSAAFRIFFVSFFLGLGALALTAAYAIQSEQAPLFLLRYWPDYYRAMAQREPDAEVTWLNRLLYLEPQDSEASLRLAAIVEWQGDLERAQALFERAARDARYRAQWALLGFQSRHREMVEDEDLWRTARRCFTMSHGDRRTLLETVWQLRPDADLLLAQVIPDLPSVLFQTTSFLMEQDRLPAARQAFSRLIALPAGSASRANAGIVATLVERAHLGLDLTDLHLDRHDPAAALKVWHSLAEHHLVQVDGSDGAGRQVMNPRFRTDPLGRGFDWRMKSSPGVEMRRTDDGWRVDFGGHPPERIALMSQRVILNGPVIPEVSSNAPAWVRATLVDESTGQEIVFPTREGRVARLRVEYSRPPGQPPLREPLTIRRIRWRTP